MAAKKAVVRTRRPAAAPDIANIHRFCLEVKDWITAVQVWMNDPHRKPFAPGGAPIEGTSPPPPPKIPTYP